VFARPRTQTAVVTLALAALALAGCQSGTSGAPAPAETALALPTTATSTTGTTAASRPTTTVPATTSTTSSRPVVAADGHGKVVVLDPGHNGGNAGHPAQINTLVPAGRGQEKACNTTGTSTNAGYSEHAFNWDVANRVRAELVAHGYSVIMTRPNDTGVGPCVDERAAIGDQADAAAVVSIHGDGSDTAGAHGFHVEYSSPPLNAGQGAPSIALATAVRDAVHGQGFALSNYLGTNGLYGRADLGGLNLSDRPTALIECGNMRDAGDAGVMTSVTGRQRIADGIAAGIIAYLG
jgi:N-acetylmuramoyl-L-alanine amidase